MLYNWQLQDWPQFSFDLKDAEDTMALFREKIGHVKGLLQALSEEDREQAFIEVMVFEAMKTSAIEGEILSREDVMSSIKNNLGLNKVREFVKDRRANGISELMIAVRESFDTALDEQTLFDWHTKLMEGNKKVKVGEWRSGKSPMQVVSGFLGREQVHFEAPPSNQVVVEMSKFISWFNNTSPDGDSPIKSAPVRAAIAHVYFESIHPFEDGNGRIGRAISEKALFQTLGSPILLSISQTIEADKKQYYQSLKEAQRSNEISPWINYFSQVILDAQIQAENQVVFTIKKTHFFDQHADAMNDRQAKVIRRMLREGATGFDGGVNAKKYMSIAKTSKATATRDLQNLVTKKILLPLGGGRSTRYEINLQN